MKQKNTFSVAIKKELCNIVPTVRHCVLAELSALLDTRGDNALAEQRVSQLMRYAFDSDTTTDDTVKKATQYPLSVVHACCKRAYIRGSFLVSGTCNDPNNSYQLDFIYTQPSPAQRLGSLLQAFGLEAKYTKRKNNTVIYFKESDSIVQMLAVMQANKAMLHFENIRVLKEIGNNVNRKVNFETANLTKTVNAAVNHIDDILLIDQRIGLERLPKPLAQVARLRLTYETASLQEIGAMLDPPISKSGVNHRLKKISDKANALRLHYQA
jgi:hypothetical protein